MEGLVLGGGNWRTVFGVGRAYGRVGIMVGEGSGKGSEAVGRSGYGHMSSTQVIYNFLILFNRLSFVLFI